MTGRVPLIGGGGNDEDVDAEEIPLSPDLWWWLCGCPGGKIPLVASTSCVCSHSRFPGGVYVSIFSDSRGAFEPTLGRRFRISAAKSTPSCFLGALAKCEPFVLSLPFTVGRLLLGGLGKASMGSDSGEGLPDVPGHAAMPVGSA